MSGTLEIKTIILSITDCNKSESKSSLIKLNDYKIDRILSYKSKLSDITEIIDHLKDFNNRVNQDRDSFANNNYLDQQQDLIENMKLVINNEPYAEHMYFVPLKDDTMYMVRQLYKKEKKLWKNKYQLIQMIYKFNSNIDKLKFALFDHPKMYEDVQNETGLIGSSKRKNDGGNKDKKESEEREVD